jgi:hypothetical protein
MLRNVSTLRRSFAMYNNTLGLQYCWPSGISLHAVGVGGCEGGKGVVCVTLKERFMARKL